MGFIEESEAEGQRKAYSATDEGRAHLEEKGEEVDELFERLADMAPRERHAGGSPIGRAVKNLMTALRHRVEREGFHEDLLHEIAEILDDAARRIERAKPARDASDE
jgi:DNA-binding PadR family transcriptional regulator